mmetsp:Transcript_89868/g.159888  ORF Transcript_89868/g.159888 Transcript_89868/m.159888 type:complete len:251 (+) Transcript_89868:30-782(+)
MGAAECSCSNKDNEETFNSYAKLHDADSVALEEREPNKPSSSKKKAPVNAFSSLSGCEAVEVPTCDISSIPRSCLPDRMAGLNDQECADVLLAQAAVRGEVSDIQRAIGLGANIDTRAELCIAMGDLGGKKSAKLTPLMRASSGGHEEAVDVLIEANASLWRADSEGWTALCHSLAYGELSIARKLLAAAGPHSDRQKTIARTKKAQVIEACEENIGPEAAEALAKEYESGLLSSSGELGLAKKDKLAKV